MPQALDFTEFLGKANNIMKAEAIATSNHPRWSGDICHRLLTGGTLGRADD